MSAAPMRSVELGRGTAVSLLRGGCHDTLGYIGDDANRLWRRLVLGDLDGECQDDGPVARFVLLVLAIDCHWQVLSVDGAFVEFLVKRLYCLGFFLGQLDGLS